MVTKKLNELTLEIPDELDAYNTQYQLKVTNAGASSIEVKLYLKPDTTENLQNSWYKIEPDTVNLQGQGQSAELLLTITSPPILNKSTSESLEEVVKLMVVTNPGQKETLLRNYNLTIPPEPEKPVISLVQVGDRLTQLENLISQQPNTEELQRAISEVRGAIQPKIDELEAQNASLKHQVINYQADIIQLERNLSTQIENLETKLKQEQAKVNRLLEIEEKKRRLTEDLGNGVTLELVEIPAGKFLMGGVREITLEPFLMGKYPITQLQWFTVMGNNPSHFKGNNRPVEMVTWHDANDFCQKLSEKTGRKYQLPSESQWEYAARARTTANYFFANDEKDLDLFAWYSANSNKETHPVGEKLPNPWGLYDIVGNVWEWCTDDWQEGYNHIPTDGSAWVNNSNLKCVRGGHWNCNAFECRSDTRGAHHAPARFSFYSPRVVVLPGTL